MPKNQTHENTSRGHTNAKRLSYEEFADYKANINRLRQYYKISWTDVSLAILGDGDNPGFARSSLDARHMVTRDHARRLQAYVARLDTLDALPSNEKAKANGTGKSDEEAAQDALKARLKSSGGGHSDRRAEEYRRLCDMLRHNPYNMTWEEIAKVFHYDGSNSAGVAYKRGSSPQAARMALARAEIAKLQARYQGQAAIVPAPEKPEAKPEPEPRRLDFVDGRAIDFVSERSETEPDPSPYGWLTEVQDGLIAMAERVEEAKQNVPPILTGPYDTVIERLMGLASDLSGKRG